MIPEIAAILRGHTAAALSRTLETIGLPFAPVGTPSDLLDDPHLAASGGLIDIRLPDGRHGKAPALPISMDGQRLPKRIDPRAPGADTGDVLAELGFDAGEIAALAEAGTIGPPAGDAGNS